LVTSRISGKDELLSAFDTKTEIAFLKVIIGTGMEAAVGGIVLVGTTVGGGVEVGAVTVLGVQPETITLRAITIIETRTSRLLFLEFVFLFLSLGAYHFAVLPSGKRAYLFSRSQAYDAR
jgi:hypothetical protein